MTAHLAHWWTLIWPNLAASVIWTLPAFAWQHRRFRRHITRLLDEREPANR